MWTIPCYRKYCHLQNKIGIHQLSNPTPPPPHTHTHTYTNTHTHIHTHTNTHTHTHSHTHTHTHTHTHKHINTTHNPKNVPDNSVTSPDSHSTCTSRYWPNTTSMDTCYTIAHGLTSVHWHCWWWRLIRSGGGLDAGRGQRRCLWCWEMQKNYYRRKVGTKYQKFDLRIKAKADSSEPTRVFGQV